MGYLTYDAARGLQHTIQNEEIRRRTGATVELVAMGDAPGHGGEAESPTRPRSVVYAVRVYDRAGRLVHEVPE